MIALILLSLASHMLVYVIADLRGFRAGQKFMRACCSRCFWVGYHKGCEHGRRQGLNEQMEPGEDREVYFSRN